MQLRSRYRNAWLSTGALYRFDDPAEMLFQVSADASLNDEAYIYRKHKNEDRIFRPGFFDRFPQHFLSTDGKNRWRRKMMPKIM